MAEAACWHWSSVGNQIGSLKFVSLLETKGGTVVTVLPARKNLLVGRPSLVESLF